MEENTPRAFSALYGRKYASHSRNTGKDKAVVNVFIFQELDLLQPVLFLRRGSLRRVFQKLIARQAAETPAIHLCATHNTQFNQSAAFTFTHITRVINTAVIHITTSIKAQPAV